MKHCVSLTLTPDILDCYPGRRLALLQNCRLLARVPDFSMRRAVPLQCKMQFRVSTYAEVVAKISTFRASVTSARQRAKSPVNKTTSPSFIIGFRTSVNITIARIGNIEDNTVLAMLIAARMCLSS
jgi:hypothetical protein